MKNTVKRILVAVAMWAGNTVLGQEEGGEPWNRLYTGEDATGPRVIALWQFLPGKEAEDSSGNGRTLALRGTSRFLPDGVVGGALEAFPGGADNDRPQGAMVKSQPDLSPSGAFTLEMWIKPKAEIADYPTVFLIDKKYYHYAKDLPQANWDYCLYLVRLGNGKHALTASLGFGEDSVWAKSEPVTFEIGTWRHVAFTYSGSGVFRFFVDGRPVGRIAHEGRGAIAPGKHPLVIGDRVGSIYNGFPGFISQVRISKGIVPVFSGSLEASAATGRTVFRRMEENASVKLRVLNDTGRRVDSVRVEVSFGNETESRRLDGLAADAVRELSVPVDTRLRAGMYPLSVLVTGSKDGSEVRGELEVPVRIVPRPLPNEMPVVMWGGGDFERLKYVGFTHNLGHLVDYRRVWEAGEPTEAMGSGDAETRMTVLNDYLANGMGMCVYPYPGRWVERNKKLERYLRIDRGGKPLARHNISASHPDIQEFGYNVGASIARSFGAFPALSAALIHSEIRDGTEVSFHDFEQEAARKALGFGIPPRVVSKSGVSYRSIPGFPVDRVIADDNPYLRFYTWFWKDGDGWNPLHTQVSRGLKSTGRDDIWTFYDPAVRVPSVWGSGGGVDVVSQWTYSYPDPIKIGQAADELFAMADGRPGQQVMKMTQIIWYRSQTAPKLPEKEAERADWEKEIPDAKFITIAPDHLREAFWSKMSRPIRGIMYHGWGSLFPATHKGYRHTNARTREVLKELVETVVRPLGPTLLQVPDRQADVALLESFSSQMFAGRGTYGWGGSWEADMHLILQWAGLQPRIIYDEHVMKEGLGQYKVLVLPSCDVLTKGVVARIREFQLGGGIVVGDENLCPAISPDILVESCRRTGEAREAKERLLARAAALRAELDPFYQRYADSSNPEIVPRVRAYGSTDYLFAVNDKRTYGTYVGHHRRVMEKGLPNEGTLLVRRKGGFVYDLVAHQAVEAEQTPDGLAIQSRFGPGDGRLFMISEREITAITCRVPRKAVRGNPLRVVVSVEAPRGGKIRAVVPVRLEIVDPRGELAEGSGWYGAKDGELHVTCELAPNDSGGRWTVKATELASGKSTEAYVMVE